MRSFRLPPWLAPLLHSLAGLVLLAQSGIAQVGPLVGPSVLYNYGVPLDVNRTPGLVNRFGVAGGGTSQNHMIFTGAFFLSRETVPGWRFSGRLGLALSSGRFLSYPYEATMLDSSTQLITTENEFEVYTTLGLLGLDVQLHLQPAERLLIGVGPWLSYRLNSGFIVSERIRAPDINFDGGSQSRTVIAGEEIGSGRIRFGGMASLAYTIPISPGLSLIPELHTRLDIPTLGEGRGIRAFSAGAGLSLLFDLSAPSPRDSIVPPPPLVRESDSELEASIDLYSEEDSSVARIRTSKVLHRRIVPMLPVIFFEPQSAAIPDRYATLGAGERTGFSDAALAGLEPVALYRQTLNLIGMRLREHPSTRITIYGSVTDDEPPSLARARAEKVRNYLRDIWEIDPTRAEIGGGNVQRHDRSVMITTTSREIAAPIAAEWIVRGFRAPKIRVARTISPDGRARRWKIIISRLGREIARLSSEDGAAGEFDGSFPIDDLREGETPAPLIAELVIEDMDGRTVTRRDQLPLVVEPDQKREREERIESIITSLDAAFGDLEDANQNVVDLTSSLVHDGAHITIETLPTRRSRSRSRWSADQVAGRLLERMGAASRRPGQLHLVSGESKSGWETGDLPENAIFSPGVMMVIDQ